MGSEYAEIRTDTSAGFQFQRLPVQPVDRLGLTHFGKMGSPTAKVTVCQEQGPLHSQTIHVNSYEAHSVAPEMKLTRPRDFGKEYPVT